MEKMKNLQDLLKHEIEDLQSAEDQITSALPKMIEKAKNAKLKQALSQHLKVTEEQIRRLDRIQELMKGNGEEEGEGKGFLSGLFGGSGGHKCRGMEGLITEGEKVMGEDMDPDVMDAAIIASSQKIEHYEICGYGTARAFARELKLTEVERLLTQTLNEEYASDDSLTALAVVGGLNEEAKDRSKRRGSKGQGNASGKSPGKSSKGPLKSANKSSGGRSSAGSKKASKGGSKKAGSKSTSKAASKSASKSSSKSAAKGSKAASKSSKSSSRTSSKSSKGTGRAGVKSAGRSKTASKRSGGSKSAGSKSKKSTSKGRR